MKKRRNVIIISDEDRPNKIRHHWCIEDYDTGESIAVGFAFKTDAEAWAAEKDFLVINQNYY